MASVNEAFTLSWEGSIAILTLLPPVDRLSETSLSVLAQRVLGPLEQNPPTGLILDLSRMDYINSTLLSFLLRCHKRVKDHRGEVVVTGASERVRELLILTSLDMVWPLYETRQKALAALQAKPHPA
jgi:anti-sigma B factor antagonist